MAGARIKARLRSTSGSLKSFVPEPAPGISGLITRLLNGFASRNFMLAASSAALGSDVGNSRTSEVTPKLSGATWNTALGYGVILSAPSGPCLGVTSLPPVCANAMDAASSAPVASTARNANLVAQLKPNLVRNDANFLLIFLPQERID